MYQNRQKKKSFGCLWTTKGTADALGALGGGYSIFRVSHTEKTRADTDAFFCATRVEELSSIPEHGPYLLDMQIVRIPPQI